MIHAFCGWAILHAAQGVAVVPVPSTVQGAPLPAALSSAAPLPAIAEGTFIDVQTVDRVHSKLNKVGDTFRIRLTYDLKARDAIVIPAGAEGQGEVIHAARARAAGKAGELILAARYIEHGGRRIPLRGFRIGKSGDNRTMAAMGVGLAAGPLAYLIVGGEVDVPPGTAGFAKLAASLDGAGAPPATIINP